MSYDNYTKKYNNIEISTEGGYYYYPEGKDKVATTGKIFFPNHNMMTYAGEAFPCDPRSRIWSDCSNEKSGSGRYFQMDNNIGLCDVSHRQGFSVRCVREYGPVVN